MSQTTITLGANATVTLIGTLHTSHASVKEVTEAIETLRPKVVAIELDQKRYKALRAPNRYQDLDIIKVLRRGEGFLLMANLVMNARQKRMGDINNSRAGSEMLTAADKAFEIGSTVALIDRSLQTTLLRTWRLCSAGEKSKLITGLLQCLFLTNENITKEDVEHAKTSTQVDELMETLGEYLPSLKRVLIDERNEYMAQRLVTLAQTLPNLSQADKDLIPPATAKNEGDNTREESSTDQASATSDEKSNGNESANIKEAKLQTAAPDNKASEQNATDQNSEESGENSNDFEHIYTNPAKVIQSASSDEAIPLATNRIVAVMGEGHIRGITDCLNRIASGALKIDTDSLNSAPKKSVVSKVVGFAIPIIILALIGFGFYHGGVTKGVNLAIDWVLWNGGLSALGALLALANPLTILTAFVAAPFTSLCPLIGAGIVAGLVQALVCKVKVRDLESLQTDARTIKGFYRNRLLKVLLVFILSSLGSSIGTFLGGAGIIAKLTFFTH